MKKEIFQKIEIPDGVNAEIEENILTVTGPEGENRKKFNIGELTFKKEGNQITIGYKRATKKEKKMINTIASHVKNMINGVRKKFEYKLKVCFSHFPISVEIKGDEAVVKNFLGERIPRRVKILKGVDVAVDKDIITINSSDKELAGQVAANFEKATWIRLRDRRVFQDAIVITNKPSEKI